MSDSLIESMNHRVISHRDIVNLERVYAADRGRFGGKAAHLGALTRAGLNVPAGFALSTALFVRFLRINALQSWLAGELDRLKRDSDRVGEILESIREVIASHPLDDELCDALASAWRGLSRLDDEPLVAVRSSAVSEDSGSASFAGQYESVLGVKGLDALAHAIRRVWASYYSERAFRYRARMNAIDRVPDLALVVQRLIEPRAAGVLFTVNPLNGVRGEMVVEAVYGLGEACVSGLVSPDSYLLRRSPRSRRSRVPTLVNVEIGAKEERLRLNPDGSGGLLAEAVPKAMRERPVLNEDEVVALGKLGVVVEQLFGVPQDIEWLHDESGRLYFVQARPITALRPRAHRRRSGILWTQRFSGERWTEPATPLGWSIISPILDEFIAFPELSRKYFDGAPATRLIAGHPYFNITIFRHLVWKFPNHAPPQFILEFFPKDEQEEILAAPFIWPDMRVVADILIAFARERRWRRYHWNFLTNHRAWDAFLPAFLEAIDALPERPRTEGEARQAVEVGKEWIRRYIRIHLLSLLFANLYYQLLAGLLRRWSSERGEQLLSELVAEPMANKTIETNRALLELASLAAGDPSVAAWLSDPEAGPRVETLPPNAAGRRFMAAFQALLRDYGHRSSASWEIFSPRWIDRPSMVLEMVAGLMRHGEPVHAGDVEAARTRARMEAEEKLLRAFKGYHPIRRRFLLHVLRNTQRYMTLRENQRFYFDRLLLKIKRALEALGEELARRGTLEIASDIVFLTLEEVDGVLGGTLRGEGVRRLIADRKADRERDRELTPPVFIGGERREPDPAGRTLAGLGISPGRIRGTVRVILRLADMKRLQKGDILVTRATDPGWTPWFLSLGGLITELGSRLSHGAVVAREYNIPAVVNIMHATDVLKDGQEVTLDGSRGLIYLH